MSDGNPKSTEASMCIMSNDQAEPREPETLVNPKSQRQTKDKTRVGSSGLLGNPQAYRWIDKCGTPVIYKNGMKRQDDAAIEKHPISCLLLSLLVRLSHEIRVYISRKIYGKHWKSCVYPGLCI